MKDSAVVWMEHINYLCLSVCVSAASSFVCVCQMKGRLREGRGQTPARRVSVALMTKCVRILKKERRKKKKKKFKPPRSMC